MRKKSVDWLMSARVLGHEMRPFVLRSYVTWSAESGQVLTSKVPAVSCFIEEPNDTAITWARQCKEVGQSDLYVNIRIHLFSICFIYVPYIGILVFIAIPDCVCLTYLPNIGPFMWLLRALVTNPTMEKYIYKIKLNMFSLSCCFYKRKRLSPNYYKQNFALWTN